MGFLITAILGWSITYVTLTATGLQEKEPWLYAGCQNRDKWEYLLLALGAYLVALVLCLTGMTSTWVLLVCLSIPLAYSLVRTVWTVSGRPSNKALGGTGQLALLYSVLFALGLIVGKF